MEGNFGFNSIKEANYGNCSNKKEIMKEYSDLHSLSCGEEFMNGLSWPPRSYTCSFCKREFRSAQALGGHMNVHRRDRARLRQHSPPAEGQAPNLLNLNHNPNPNPSPNPNLIPASPLSSMSSSIPTLKPLASPALPSSELKKWVVDRVGLNNPLDGKAPESTEIKNIEYLNGIGENDDAFATEDGCRVLKKPEIIKLDLGIGLVNDSKDDLDLELRLGSSYSN